jgi:hypothetical protein
MIKRNKKGGGVTIKARCAIATNAFYDNPFTWAHLLSRVTSSLFSYTHMPRTRSSHHGRILDEPDLTVPQGATLADGRIAVASSRIPDAGSGLFARVRFARNSFITRYSGHACSKVAAKRMSHAAVTHVATIDGIAIFGPNADTLLPTQGAGSLANSQSRELANAKLFRHQLALGKPEYGLWLVALRDIEPDEEITVHYADSYWTIRGL